MQCALCKQEISLYSEELHRLVLNPDQGVDICDACSLKLVQWHADKFAKLFPTKAMKNAARRRK